MTEDSRKVRPSKFAGSLRFDQTAAEAFSAEVDAIVSPGLRLAAVGIISGGFLVNKITAPAYPGRYGMHSPTYDALLRDNDRMRQSVVECPDCIGYPCECGTAGGGC